MRQIESKQLICLLCMYILASPFLLVYYIIFQIFINPVKFIINYKNRQQCQKARKNQINTVVHDVDQLKGEYYPSLSQNLFLFKPCNIDLYITVNDNEIKIINTDLVILGARQIKYQFSSGQNVNILYKLDYSEIFKVNLLYSNYVVPPGYATNVCIYHNEVYFTCFEFVFRIRNLNVELVAQLPNFGQYFKKHNKQDLTGGLLFTINDKLYVHNIHNKLFEIRNDKLKCVNRKHFDTFYYQFCDIVVAITPTDIFTVSSDLKLTHVVSVYRVKVLFTNGGSLLMINNSRNNQNEHILMAYNMLDNTLTKVTNILINQHNIANYVILGPTGFQLKNEVLSELYGPDFSSRMISYYKEFSSKNQLSSEYKQMIFNSNLNKIFETRFQRVESHLYIAKQRMISGCNKINAAVGTLIPLESKLSMCYNIFEGEVVQ
ncbi:Conserved_hypothetical protein [Hexamita inflata]|uniref:Transmembrane protein n=1 Tax=Hexamita inflata TaxID=28002 RepID=A0AA86P688_9EUKA|nr:Conserved hypothetical protein [Hexamita inflata]